MRTLLLIFFIATSINAFGQELMVGMRGGLNLTAEKERFPKDFRSGFIGGLEIGIKSKNHVSVELNFLYNQRGFKETYINNRDGERRYNKYYYDYISFPIKFGYRFGDRAFVSPKIGFMPSILLKAEAILPDYKPESYVPNGSFTVTDDTEWIFMGYEVTDIKSYVKPSYDFALLFEFDLGYKISKSIELFSLISYSSSFTWFSNSGFIFNTEMKHYGYSFCIGARYNISIN